MDMFYIMVLMAVVLVFPFLAVYAAATASTSKRRVDDLERQVSVLGRRLRDFEGAPHVLASEAEQADVASKPELQTAPSEPVPQPPSLPEPAPRPSSQTETATRPSPLAATPVWQPTSDKSQSDLERVIGGKWLNWIGIATLLIATAFFLKYAFDNNWVGPTGRIAIGFLAGASLMLYSQFLFKKTYVYFSEGIAGLGAGVLFLSLWAAWSSYHLIPTAGALAGMVLVTAVLLAFALARDSQRVALLALIGGFITPMLLDTGAQAEVQLFTYLAVLNAGLLWVAHVRNWRTLPIAFLFTVIYFWGWFNSYYEPSMLPTTLAFATLFFVEFAVVPLSRALRFGTLYPEQAALVLLNAVWFTVALHFMLFGQHRWLLTVAIVALAIGHLVSARFTPIPPEERPLARVLLAGLALTFITLAIPIRLQGQWITIGWALEGAILVWTGLETRTQWLRIAGVALFVLVAVRLVVAPIEGGQLFFNQRFGTFVAVIACLGAASYLARSKRDELGHDELTIFRALEVAINVLALWALSAEVLNPPYSGQRQELLLTLVWTLYAAALLIIGVRTNSSLLRWQGLVLLGVCVVKVFLYDLSELALGFRILSFVALGVVLLGISFLYQKRLQPGRRGEDP